MGRVGAVMCYERESSNLGFSQFGGTTLSIDDANISSRVNQLSFENDPSLLTVGAREHYLSITFIYEIYCNSEHIISRLFAKQNGTVKYNK